MLSLRDKLKAAGTAKPKAAKPAPKDCMVKEVCFPLSSFTFLEVRVKKGNRKDLGRPTTTPVQNKEALMDFLRK